ncbi:MAG: tryptophan synthase subunit alpha [Microbacteriaceae bacterium]|nr:tryptophan synthase subunit alpha [Microbacteriaceae bacterium]HPZ35416.1 tryptophan synthase subunit alpha [Microbacteriaceae bacterium]HQC92701.1 tryptophan synthase subunit alpha [Microbacteriaceae bacterium]
MSEIRIHRRASLEVLRAEASQELETVVHERLRSGQDPWEFMEELPTVDELVVWLLRADAIVANGSQLPSHLRDYRVLRQIALEHPELTPTVWRMIGDDPLAASAS